MSRQVNSLNRWPAASLGRGALAKTTATTATATTIFLFCAADEANFWPRRPELAQASEGCPRVENVHPSAPSRPALASGRKLAGRGRGELLNLSENESSASSRLGAVVGEKRALRLCASSEPPVARPFPSCGHEKGRHCWPGSLFASSPASLHFVGRLSPIDCVGQLDRLVRRGSLSWTEQASNRCPRPALAHLASSAA